MKSILLFALLAGSVCTTAGAAAQSFDPGEPPKSVLITDPEPRPHQIAAIEENGPLPKPPKLASAETDPPVRKRFDPSDTPIGLFKNAKFYHP